MIYLFLMSIALLIAFITYVIATQNERRELIELLSAKDYAEYKNFNDEPKPRSERKTMFSIRDKKDTTDQE